MYLSLAAVDDPAVASWFIGRKDDSFVVARADPAAVGAESLTTVLDVTATGSVIGAPYDVLCGIAGLPASAEVVLLFVVPRAFRIPANPTSSQLKAGTAATGESVFSVQKNGVQFLTATVAAAGTGQTRKRAADNPTFRWLNTLLGNLETSLRGTFHAIAARYVPRYLAQAQYRFNRRYDLDALLPRLANAAIQTQPWPLHRLTKAEFPA